MRIYVNPIRNTFEREAALFHTQSATAILYLCMVLAVPVRRSAMRPTSIPHSSRNSLSQTSAPSHLEFSNPKPPKNTCLACPTWQNILRYHVEHERKPFAGPGTPGEVQVAAKNGRRFPTRGLGSHTHSNSSSNGSAVLLLE